MRWLIITLATLAPGLAWGQTPGPSDSVYEPPEPLVLRAEALERHAAAEAGQGVAVDRHHFYAIVNFAIGKYDRHTGEKVDGLLG